MTGWALATVSAFWLGLLTSVSPCPLASNIAAMSYVGRDVGNGKRTLLAGLLYTAGRVLAYAGLAAVVVAGLLAIPDVARFLQVHMNRIVGPLLVALGLVLLEWLPLPDFGSGLYDRVGGKMVAAGLAGALPLGAVLALAFCPVSAGLFFGGLIPLALEHRSAVWLPVAFGVGTGLPVVVFAILLAAGVRRAAAAFHRLQTVERWTRRVTAVVILGIGAYYTWRFTFTGGSVL